MVNNRRGFVSVELTPRQGRFNNRRRGVWVKWRPVKLAVQGRRGVSGVVDVVAPLFRGGAAAGRLNMKVRGLLGRVSVISESFLFLAS